MKKKVRHHEYIKDLLEDRKQENIVTDPINERSISQGKGLTSPTSNLSTEETRILMEYMEQQNLFSITEGNSERKKILTLKKFFKMKRNQQVEVYSRLGDKNIYSVGKVSGVGRDHVMLTDLKSRFWIPYFCIESANIPYGIPNYSNTHQHFMYDNKFREKLLYEFGKTVPNRETLYQLFNEDSLSSSLNRWIGSWVEVHLGNEQRRFGKITEVTRKNITLSLFSNKQEILFDDIHYVETVRFLQMIKKITKLF